MSVRIVALLFACGLAVGCARNIAKNTAPTQDETASAKPQPPALKDSKSAKADEPNWLNDNRFKKEPTNAAAANGSSPAKQPSITNPPQGGGTPNTGVQPTGPTTPMPPPAVPGPAGNGASQPAGPAPGVAPPPGMGVLQPNPAPVNPPALAPGGGTPIGAAKKTVAMADMREVWIFIENASGVSGKMPTTSEIKQALAVGGSPAAGLVKDGAISLTGATTRESVWAYETRALTNGGMVVSQNGVETLTATELKTRLGK